MGLFDLPSMEIYPQKIAQSIGLQKIVAHHRQERFVELPMGSLAQCFQKAFI